MAMRSGGTASGPRRWWVYLMRFAAGAALIWVFWAAEARGQLPGLLPLDSDAGRFLSYTAEIGVDLSLSWRVR